jgi:protein-S-isoprenylcysteine O-methyltransferase Ste14
MSIEASARLAARAWLHLAVLTALLGLVLFGCAGTLRYWEGWAYLAIFGGQSALVTLYLLKRDPALLERRMRGGPVAEGRPAQRIIMLLVSIAYVALFAVPGLDHRLGWSSVPLPLVIAGDVLVAISLYLVFLVFRENSYTCATVEVVEGQRVISTGPYAIVRHPMYASGAVYLFGTPLALGSWWGFAAIAVMMPFLIWRLLDEERLLAAELPGYRDYQKRVRHRLIPGVW